MTHTYALLEVSPAVHAEIRAKLQAAGYEHAFHREDDREVIDMHGIGVVAVPPETRSEPPPIPPPGLYWAKLNGEPDRWQPVEVHARSDGRLFVVMLGDEGNGNVVEWGPALYPPGSGIALDENT